MCIDKGENQNAKIGSKLDPCNEQNRLIHIFFHVVALGFIYLGWLFSPFAWSAKDIDRNLFVISVNDGLVSGSGDQHCSINFLQLGSQHSGIAGRRVFFTIPPAYNSQTKFILHITNIVQKYRGMISKWLALTSNCSSQLS